MGPEDSETYKSHSSPLFSKPIRSRTPKKPAHTSSLYTKHMFVLSADENKNVFLTWVAVDQIFYNTIS